MHLAHGIYEALLDEVLQDALAKRPELRRIFGKIDNEEQPALYASFVAKVLEQALREETDPEKRLALCNRILGTVAAEPGREHLEKHRLVPEAKPLLLEITPPNYNQTGLPRPHTSLAESSLFTGSPQEPQLAHELLEEMRSADGVDILVSFIKWSGLRLLMPAFEDLRDRQVPVRLITTSYMGASDSPAVEWLAQLPNVQVRVSYDTERTRLHAKAYHFRRQSGFSTAYIGSANMSHAAITSGLEWNLKVTAQDMAHILDKFSVEFETYWNSREFAPFDPDRPELFRSALARAKGKGTSCPAVFFDLRPHPFQERILEALERERSAHDRWRNLVIAATGTGKTVVAAFDFKRFYQQRQRQARLLFLAHRQEILQQAQTTFRNVLRDQNFGELQVGSYEASRLEHLFCSVGMLTSRRFWEQVGRGFYDYIVVDEAHHGTATSYRPIFDHFEPQILLGLTATPERMDGDNVAADFGNRFAAEIRLPEALEEKLLCPFHYFGIADPIAINGDQFWRNGKYDAAALEGVYVLDQARAHQRVEAVITALHRYEPDVATLKGIGFCVTIRHAEYMAEQFNQRGIPSAPFVSGIDTEQSADLLANLRNGQLTFLFTVDKLSEGVDVPEINTVLFLRPTESLTVFLQQLGRGLRHAPEKDCLTILDFVGQAHRRYRIDTKLKALLPRHRFAIDKEVEQDFPHLPAGCAIQLDRLSRQYVLENIRENFGRLTVQVPDRLQTFTSETGQELTFGNFIRYHDYEPEVLLAKESWSEWKAKAQLGPIPIDPDLARLKKAMIRAAFINGPHEATLLREVLLKLSAGQVTDALALPGTSSMLLYYRIWGDKAERVGITSLEDAFRRLAANPTVCADMDEILAWSLDCTEVAGTAPELPFSVPLELHAQYGIREIQAAFGRANLESSGQTGVGVMHFAEVKTYALLVTFQKTEKEFSPSTMYADYPISRELLHWESQANTAQHHTDGQNLIHHQERSYTILVFARGKKKKNGVTVPFTYLGPVERVSYESERPIKIVWQLRHSMPVEIFEDNRRGG
ncbi:RNA helicase [Geoanaerobacter pelophilus]|uniref:RNA helicase n=1 Tax=Geoanaerobacter pelophilus TaxID=60036 RepID=A0ABQ0MKB7_9BACT|nr:DEAD/DEAH box helicase [Geoanaerobacter pelophilus]GAW67518.1 RNA helicase [Geoanaerobacter pelophilus]